MDMPSSLAHRTLKSLKDYISYADCPSEIPDWARVGGDERILGIYTNHSNVNSDRIIVTDQSLYRISDQQAPTVIHYIDIQSIDFPMPVDAGRVDQNHPQAGQVLCLKLTKKSGSTVFIPILSGQESTRDLYSFGTFVKRIVEHIRSEQNRGL